MTMKKFISIILTLTLVLCAGGTAFASDIDYSQWNSGGKYPSDITNTEYFLAVKILMDRGAITGDTDGLFHPGKNITRAEFAKIIAISTNNAANLDEASRLNTFNDLSGYTWAKPYINAAARAGILSGVGGGRYEPGRNVTYAEVVTALLKATNTNYDQIVATGTWPQNVISYAQMYNTAGDTLITDWTAAATKGNVAKLVYRNLPKGATEAAYSTLNKSTISAGGGAATLSVAPATPGITTTFQWYRNNVAIAGATSNTLSIPAPALNDEYYVVITTEKVGYKATTVRSNTCTVGP